MMLAKTLGSSMKLSAPEKLAFTLGNIAPDINPFSYLIRSGSNNLGGHNYDSRKKYIINMWKKLEKRRHTADWFRAGEMLHYLVDSFTRPHNKEFPYSVKEHVAYEHELHLLFTKVLHASEASESVQAVPSIDNFADWLENLHAQYLAQAQNIDDDCNYILQVYAMACNALAAQSQTDAAIAGAASARNHGGARRPDPSVFHPQPTVLTRPRPDTAM